MLQMLKALIKMTALEPRQAALTLKHSAPAYPQVLQFALLVVIAESVIAVVFGGPEGNSAVGFINQLISNPLMLAAFQFATFCISVGLVFVIGRYFGGTGTLHQTLFLSAWLQFFMLLLQIAMLPLTVISLSLLQTIAVAANIFAVWVFTNFIAELHGFSSLLKVFAGIVGIFFAVIFVVVLLLSWVGIDPVGV